MSGKPARAPSASRTLRPRDSNRKVTPNPNPPVPRAKSPEVIVLSSDEDEVPIKYIAKKRKTAKSSSKSKASSDVINNAPEIVLQEEPHSNRRIAELEEELRRMKEANEELKRTQAEVVIELTEEVDKLQRSQKRSLSPSLFEDTILCEVCVTKMLNPYTITECGHTFCLSCLQDWFNTTLAKHMQQHPHYVAVPPIPRGINWTAQQIRHYYQQHRAMYPQPEYTCPTCRVRVDSKPMQVFALKDIISTISKALSGSQQSPERPPLRGPHGGPWDGFFPD